MAAVVPTQLFANYDSDGTVATFPLASLPLLTAAEADPATGNGTEVVRAIVDAAFVAINALEVANRPTNFSIAKGALQSANSTDVVTQTYTITIRLQPTALNVAPEA